MSSKKYVLGSIQIVDGTQGEGKVLISDSDGLATWSNVSGGVGLSGSGAINRLSKWTSSTGLGNSLLQDNGTSISFGTSPNTTYGFYSNYSSGQASIFGQNTYPGPGESIGVVGAGTGVGGTNNIGGSFVADNNTTLNIGVKGSSQWAGSLTNIGGLFQALNSTSNYSVQLTDGTQGVGKVLTCITSDGKANWATASVANLQKIITTTYELTDADNDYTIFINNGATAISISLGSITIANFCVGFIQEGSADVTFVGVTNPVGLKSKGQGYQTFIERKLATATYYLLGNTKA